MSATTKVAVVAVAQPVGPSEPAISSVLRVAEASGDSRDQVRRQWAAGLRWCWACQCWVPLSQTQNDRELRPTGVQCECDICRAIRREHNLAGGKLAQQEAQTWRQTQRRYNGWTDSTVTVSPHPEAGHVLHCETHGTEVLVNNPDGLHQVPLSDWFHAPFYWCNGCSATGKANSLALGDIAEVWGTL